MLNKLFTFVLLFQLYEAYAMGIFFAPPFYVTQTTVVKFENGQMGSIIVRAIPIDIWVIQNDNIYSYSEVLPGSTIER